MGRFWVTSPFVKGSLPSGPVQVPLPQKFVDAAGDVDQPAAVKPVEEGREHQRAEGLEEPRAEAKPTQWKRYNLAKQSGVPNITWHKYGAWQVMFPTFDKKGHRNLFPFDEVLNVFCG